MIDSKQANDEGTANEGLDDIGSQFTVHGYVVQNNGIFQVLYERGVYLSKMKGRQTQGVKEKFELKGKPELVGPIVDVLS